LSDLIVVEWLFVDGQVWRKEKGRKMKQFGQSKFSAMRTLLLLLLLLLSCVTAFYLPGVYPKNFEEQESVSLKVCYKNQMRIERRGRSKTGFKVHANSPQIHVKFESNYTMARFHHP
jgi:hypothetical protein